LITLLKLILWQLTKKSIFQWFPHFLLGGVNQKLQLG